MAKILVSACLIGDNCRYKGDNCKNAAVLALSGNNQLIPVCPEQLGGLPTPRKPGERVGDKVMTKDGDDITAEYMAGAKRALELATENKVDYCIMKANSPSCGKDVIYDGTFTGGKKDGNGVTTELLLGAGFAVLTENEI